MVGTLMVSSVVAGGTYLLVSRRLANERLNAVLTQSFKKVGTLDDELATGPKTASELVTRVQRKGLVVVIPKEGAPGESSIQFRARDVPSSLRNVVARGGVAYVFSEGRRRLIIFGSLIPRSVGTGEVYFAYPVGNLDRTLGLLRKIFVAVVAAAAFAAGVVGIRLASATIRPLRLAAEAATRVAEGNLSTRLDVSSEDELGRLAGAFNNMAVALEERIARERRFVADVSHELRTPLTSLKTSIDFLADRRDDIPPRLRGPLSLAADEVRSLQRLVDDLLELTRVDAGDVVAEREDVDLVNFANELTRRRAPGATVVVTGPEQLVVRTDKMRLERVVGNLLENAVFHGGGRSVRIDLDQVDGEALISVVDQGPGIDPEKLPRIFDRFWRGDISRQRDGRIGSGLGLSIARENALIIGAQIEVQSLPGEGARFDVRIPTGAA
jgi:two-component system sensor histidine kinase MtrB